MIKSILQCKPVGFKGALYSPEHQRFFKTEHFVAKVEENAQKAGQFRLTLDNLDPGHWFRQKQQEFLQSIGISVKERTEASNNKVLKR